MIQATSMRELTESLFPKSYPEEVIKDLLYAMFRLERELGTNKNEPPTSYILIAEDERERIQAEKVFGLTGRMSDDTDIIRANGEYWEKQMYADEGCAEIYIYARLATGVKNGIYVPQNRRR